VIAVISPKGTSLNLIRFWSTIAKDCNSQGPQKLGMQFIPVPNPITNPVLTLF